MLINMADVVGPLAAGLGLFFVGVSLVGSNLKKMTSRKLRLFFMRFTKRDWQSALLGLVSGFTTQSTSVSAFIVAGLTQSGLMTVRRGLPVIFWANAGCSLLVLIAVFDIRYLVFGLLFLTGLGFAFDLPKNHRHLVRALFGIALLFYGLQLITASAAPLAQADWVRDLMAQTHGSNLVALGLGALLTMITQTAIGIVLVAIALIKSGIFSVDQTIMIIYGVHLGSCVLTWLLALGVHGTPKQLIMAQVVFNVVGVLAMVALFYVETLGGVPLVKALLQALTPDLQTQMALLVILFNWAVPMVLFPVLTPMQRLLGRFWPPTKAEAMAKIRFIHDHALDDPGTAVLLVEKELVRLFNRLPRSLQSAREALEGTVSQGKPLAEALTLHAAYAEVAREVDGVLADLSRGVGEGPAGEELVRLNNLRELLDSLEQSVHQFCLQAPQAAGIAQARSFYESLLESLDFLLVTAGSALEGDPDDRQVLAMATRDRGQVLEEVRRNYLTLQQSGGEQGMGFEGKQLMHYASGLFERTAWLLGRLASQMRERADQPPAPDRVPDQFPDKAPA